MHSRNIKQLKLSNANFTIRGSILMQKTTHYTHSYVTHFGGKFVLTLGLVIMLFYYNYAGLAEFILFEFFLCRNFFNKKKVINALSDNINNIVYGALGIFYLVSILCLPRQIYLFVDIMLTLYILKQGFTKRVIKVAQGK